MGIFNSCVQGVQLFCWADGSVSEFSVSYASWDFVVSGIDGDFVRGLAPNIVGIGFQSLDGRFYGRGECFCPRFGSNVQAWCSPRR